MVITSASRESGYQSNLDPRPSIAKTSISIPSVIHTESSKQEGIHKNENSITKHISRLELASNYLTPVIDEIISRATSYTKSEFRELLETRSPICAISVGQFTRACKASNLIDEVQKNPYAISEYVVNTVTRANEDRIFIDRDLMNQLVDLQNMIVETIKRLKGTLADDMFVENVRKDLEENFVIFDEAGEEIKNEQNYTKFDDNVSGIQTLTVNVDKNMKYTKQMEKVSEMTAELPTLADLCMPLDYEPIIESDAETEKTEKTEITEKTDTLLIRKSCRSIEDEVKSDDDSELILKTEYNEAENVVIIPDVIKETECEYCTCSKEDVSKPVSEKPETEFVDEKCRIEVAKFQLELDKMKDMLSTLSNEVQLIKGGNFEDKIAVKVSQPTSTSNNCRNISQEHLEMEILDCLKELRQIKDALSSMNNPELTLDTTPRDHNGPCCTLHNFPHLHARIDGIPVIIKLNKSSIDILLSENKNHDGKEVQITGQADRKCLCSTRKKQESIVLTKVQSSVHTKYNAIPYPHNNKYEQVVVKKKHKSVVQSAFTNHCIEGIDLDDRESITGLPYTVNKKSLPNMNICPPMNIKVDQLKKGMRSNTIEHPKNCIRKQLTAVGVDNLIKASIPAECCRKAVINEAERDDQPFHASINSLPLTTSDLQIITDVTSNQTCMHHTKQKYQNKFEYYTNFQENLASNIDYYMPKSRVYEVRFFRIFKKDEQKPTKTGLAERLSEVLRRIIYNDASGEGTKASEQVPPKLKRNKKCQTDELEMILKPSSVSLPQQGKIHPTHKSKKHCYTKVNSTNKSKSCSVQCRMPEEGEGSRNKSKQKTKIPAKRSAEMPMKYSQCYNSNQSIFACNTNLGTIYESEERHPRKKLKDRPGKKLESFYDFMNSPTISESFQKFLTTEAAIKALERSNMDTQQFWGMYFEAKRSHKSLNCDRGSIDSLHLPRRAGPSASQQRNRYGKYGRNSVSKIPKRIVKHTFSSSSSDFSTTRRKKKLKTQERTEKKEFVVKVKPKLTDPSVEPKRKVPETSSTLSLLEIASKYDAVDKAKIFFNENMNDTPSTDFKDNSLESLQLLASKNGPGYITVLHPVCGCPEVSIFIPCYCPVTSNNSMSQQTVHKLVCKNDGRHIILPKGCRVEKYEEDHSKDRIKDG